MKKLKRWTGVAITNFLLICALFLVSVVGFLPEKVLPIYGGNELTAIYKGDENKKQVSLMFNVYENTEIVLEIAEVLEKYDVKGTFFVGGCWADDNAPCLNRLVYGGHEIGNHGYFHKDHKSLDYQTNKQEIHLTGVVVSALCGKSLTLFAPPSGSYSLTTLEVCAELGYKTIMWSKDTIDWRDSDENKIISRATENLSNGDLILMHPKAHTLSALPTIVERIKAQGYDVVTVSDNI